MKRADANIPDMLAQLLVQAEGEGADLITLRAMVEEASELGAQRVLTAIGLDDDHASADLIELRQLLRAWRDATVARIVATAGGNAFYLEELIRSVAEGHGDELIKLLAPEPIRETVGPTKKRAARPRHTSSTQHKRRLGTGPQPGPAAKI